MTYFFNEFFFLQVFILVLLVLFFINIMPYTLLFLGTLFICSTCLLLSLCGLNLFVIYLLMVEMHIFYLILCLTFTWVRYETTHISHILSSSILMGGRLFFFFCLLLAFSQFILYSINLHWFGLDLYTYTIILSRGVNLVDLISGVNLTMLTILVNSFLTFNSFEFCLLNFIMFLASILYFFIALLARTSRYLYETYRISKVLKFFRITAPTTIKRTNQGWQLTRCASSLYKQGRPHFVKRKLPKKN